ncbi:metal-sensitive transcriptional regulator [Haloimpatiens massiliensis]|uniref:metal-sensitive transcriptional regulator n=1 Tax=Haloimpatiens massiliensis TaxID=1658110 RepID=UPI000C81BADD|nr:metal-sensitive transcriptional regulator [Haloimpatiens massiliensis]
MSDKKDPKRDIQIRMRRIEGQVKGIQKMIDNDACCKDLLVQVAAVRAAINKVGSLILQNYAERCFFCDEETDINKEKMNELVDTINMFLK